MREKFLIIFGSKSRFLSNFANDEKAKHKTVYNQLGIIYFPNDSHAIGWAALCYFSSSR